jgi:aminoglycoside phosphotransferase (APT) family kinase protein
MRATQGRPGELVAKGNTSDVWHWTAATVVKVLHPGIPRHWAALEADITRRVHAAGLPAPATDGLVEVDGRPGIVFERIEGVSMWDRMRASPGDLPRLVETLVDLQTGLHDAGPIDGVPGLVTRLSDKIEAAETLPMTARQEALVLLATLPTGTALCHGDMHPANVLMTAHGPIVIDWFDAVCGHPVADLVRSSLLMRPPVSVMSADRYLEGATPASLERLHVAYLAVTQRRGLVPADLFAGWEAVMAVARMSEPVPTEDLVAVWEGWRAGTGTLRAGAVARTRLEEAPA